MKKISIVIVTYNSLRLIRDCLDSIFENNDIGDSLDVIIVDNASTDQGEMFALVKEKFGGKPIKLLNTGENSGYGKGNNFGIRRTDADIVMVMNPDVRFVVPIFKDILKEFENSNLGMVGVNFIDGSCPYYFKPEYNSFLRGLFIHQIMRRNRYDSLRMYMSGSLLAFDRETFIEAGMYDENIFMYYEEPDITNRIQRLGKDVKWMKDAMVLHLAHGRKFNETLTSIRYSSLEYYCKKYGIVIEKRYADECRILRIKRLVSKILRDKDRYDVFDKTIRLINHRAMTIR